MDLSALERSLSYLINTNKMKPAYSGTASISHVNLTQ